VFGYRPSNLKPESGAFQGHTGIHHHAIEAGERDAMNRRLMPLCAGCATMMLAASARSELLYEFTFNATVTQTWGDNPDHPWGGVEVGDPAYFKYVIDVEQEDQSPSQVIGRYTVSSAEISYGGIAVEPGFISLLEVNTATTTNDDLVKIVTRQVWTDNFFEGAIFELRGFNVLPDDSIPIDFNVLDFSIERSIEYGDGTISFRAVFDSYSYQIIPAPGAAFGLALGVMFRGGRRRRC